jgi:hypothetical protein
VASPLSSTAVTSTVAVRAALTAKLAHDVCPRPLSNPVHHPPAATGCGDDSTPSPTALGALAASAAVKLITAAHQPGSFRHSPCREELIADPEGFTWPVAD